MEYIYYPLSILTVVLTFLPKIQHQHWIFRIATFGKIHITAFQIILLVFGFFAVCTSLQLFIFQFILTTTILNSTYILYPYLLKSKNKNAVTGKNFVSIISVNVYQFNTEYHHLIKLIKKYQPDILLTIESNKDWEKAILELDNDYTNYKKIALENTYGMHFYTQLAVENINVNYFVADDIPSIKATLKTKDKQNFVFYGIHPPPASPTEEPNSKEKDGELLSIAKKIKQETLPTVVIGDFNSVAWSRITKLFTKISGLKDARIGRGFLSTFPANYRFFKIPLDLMYHTKDISVRTLKTLENINSDHLPLYAEFSIHQVKNNQHKASDEVLKKADELIIEGEKETSEQR
ncbi:endonuclease/exonuclease/phosphatase (EEP) superfamily protein YafD [Wenyingzhuangia heitensis]|uniref:Endonuclease/exonuclease/phosphatase (EEP) superfamily protein YafD n=1 Tax=Wenyingzhuangia heitensis TaxID=1487859 RepID=A0ABX0U8V0_9FLAO|nr:endonuclease/exonuclease/phosphatase family protein [Wenyingzhuangia heitensis]NIJ45269.1 endonuclease/exonuclease/phosphatase (EEP) superfamily protein YafD [Wenyingzhuangia heitensis]